MEVYGSCFAGGVLAAGIGQPGDGGVEFQHDGRRFNLGAVAEVQGLGCMRVLDQRQVIAALQSAVRGGPDAPIGGSPGEDDMGHTQ